MLLDLFLLLCVNMSSCSLPALVYTLLVLDFLQSEVSSTVTLIIISAMTPAKHLCLAAVEVEIRKAERSVAVHQR